MKKLLLLLLSCILFVSGCGEKKDEDGIIEITERVFVEQCNDVYLNPQEYIGKTFKLEGMFDFYYDVENEYFYYYVLRFGPGCCGYDSNVGFEVIWDDEYPEPNDWVEAVGVLEEYVDEIYNYETVRLRLTSLKVLDERGAETVQ